VTEVGLKQQKNSTSRELAQQGEGENQQDELKGFHVINLCPRFSVDPRLQSLTHPGYLQFTQLSELPVTWYLNAEIPHIRMIVLRNTAEK